jgi:hypothetical protein
VESDKALKIGTAIHDGTYSIDFAIHRISLEDEPDDQGIWIVNHVIPLLSDYRQKHVCKLLGVGITTDLHKKSPSLCSRLWAELDVIPIIVQSNELPLLWTIKTEKWEANVDELADSAARKCVA